ncbi:Chromobox protein 1 [Homalodisca vitripennis]|nr:Chromobox protein 1 [Homalodisca vitripennis]
MRTTYVAGRVQRKTLDVRRTSRSVEGEDNTWEPEENLDCPELIQEFKDSRKKRDSNKRQQDSNKEEGPKQSAKKKKTEKEDTKTQPKKKVIIEEDNRPRGFERNLEPEKVIGATDASGELMFLMKW